MQGISGRLNPPSPLVAAGAKVPDFRPAAGVLQCEASQRSHEGMSQSAGGQGGVGRNPAADMAGVGHNGTHYLGRGQGASWSRANPVLVSYRPASRTARAVTPKPGGRWCSGPRRQ